jgi:hypothetical protein
MKHSLRSQRGKYHLTAVEHALDQSHHRKETQPRRYVADAVHLACDSIHGSARAVGWVRVKTAVRWCERLARCGPFRISRAQGPVDRKSCTLYATAQTVYIKHTQERRAEVPLGLRLYLHDTDNFLRALA